MSSGLWLMGFRVPKEKGSSDNISAFLRGGVLEHDTLMIDTCVLFSHRPIGWSVWAIRRLGGPPFDGVRGPDGDFGINDDYTSPPRIAFTTAPTRSCTPSLAMSVET